MPCLVERKAFLRRLCERNRWAPRRKKVSFPLLKVACDRQTWRVKNFDPRCLPPILRSLPGLPTGHKKERELFFPSVRTSPDRPWKLRTSLSIGLFQHLFPSFSAYDISKGGRGRHHMDMKANRSTESSPAIGLGNRRV